MFFKVYDKRINKRYILITHNSDRNIGGLEVAYMSKNVKHWFAQNLLVSENKNISFIPIGLENLRRLRNGRKKWFKNRTNKKTKIMLSSFNVFTNYKIRKPVKNLIENFHFVESKEFESTKDYFTNLVDYMFVIVP